VVAPPPPPPAKKKRRVGWIITVVLLALALIAALVMLALSLMQLDDARTEIEKQQELLDQKETFGTAMQKLVETADQFDGVLFGNVVTQGDLERLATRGYDHRWDAAAVARDTVAVQKAQTQLEDVLAAATEQASANSSGTAYESVIDALGSGFVTAVVDDADGLCASDVLGCVISDDPYTVHFDAADAAQPYMTDFLKTGVAYHEFAHVLQMTNPGPTRIALEAFGGDPEIMADCYALTYLDGWTLHHTIFTSPIEYYEVDIGYGYTCDQTQQQAVVDWVGAVGYHSAPVSQ